MPDQNSTEPKPQNQQQLQDKEGEAEENGVKQQLQGYESSSSDSDSDSEDSDSDSERKGDEDEDEEPPLEYVRPGDETAGAGEENTAENNIRMFEEVLNSKRFRREREEEEEMVEDPEELFDFPEDPENWREEDLRELWDDAPMEFAKPGWDPDWADEEDWEVMRKEAEEGRDPPIQPFYVPFRKPYPVVPDNHPDISTPKAVIEELDRIEEFLKWVSYIFPDEST